MRDLVQNMHREMLKNHQTSLLLMFSFDDLFLKDLSA